MNSSIILKLVSAFVALFLIILLSSNLLSGVRLDLSEGGLYSLSDGTESILENLESDVTIDYYFSEQATSQLPALRTYAKRVEELLTEYESKSNGKLSINKIDPAPFSEQEDEAALAGLQSVPGGARGDEIYFGLVAKNAAGREEVVPFIQPDKEAFLEYDLTRLISALSRETLPKIGIYSGADIRGGFDVMSRQQTPEWAALQFINDNFDLEWIEDDADAIEGVDMLLLIAPQDLSQRLQLAIDQYALSGGKVMVFVDPYIETMAMMNGMATVQSSNISALFESWGVAFDESQFITDFENSMVVSLGQGGQPTRHLGLLSLGPNALSQDDVVMFGLESINLSSVGAMSAAEGASTVFTPVIQSSAQSALADVNVLTTLNDPSTLMNDFVPTEQRYTIAARVGGPAESAFPDGITVSEELADGEGSVDLKLEPSVLSSENVNIMIVADSDVLSDRLWVQVQNFFGQQIISPWADNGSLLLNSVENLSGQSELISIRGQGRYSRPFERVEALQRDAEERFLAQQEALEAQLIATEEQMFELEQMRDGGDVVSLTEEQNKALLRFQEEKLKIRKQLRDVQHQLDQDIDALGTKLKLINIFLVPVLICFFALMLGFRQRRIANA